MRRLLAATIIAGAFALPVPAQAHIGLSQFTIAPECVAPGQPVAYDVRINQDHWYHVHTLWARISVTHTLTGIQLFAQDEGPQYVPAGSYSTSGAETVPTNAPPGDYSVALALGSSQGGTQWASTVRTLRVRPLGLCVV